MSCSLLAIDNIKSDTFENYGKFKKIIKTRNLTGITTIDTLNIESKNTYGVGALGSATGEITIFNGKVYLSYGKAGGKHVLNHIPKGENTDLTKFLI